MATTLSFGFVKPVDGDKGSVFWPALEDDIQQLNDHTHDGSDSAILTAAASAAVTQTINSASWVSAGNGLYSQTVTFPAGITYDTHSIQHRNNTGGAILLLSVVKVSSSQYTVYINDNSITLKAIYT